MVTVGAMVSYVTVLSVQVEPVLSTLPAASWTVPDVMLAVTVPLLVMPSTATSYVPLLVTEIVSLVGTAVPPSAILLVEKPVTPSLKTTVKWIGDPLVGSTCDDA